MRERGCRGVCFVRQGQSRLSNATLPWLIHLFKVSAGRDTSDRFLPENLHTFAKLFGVQITIWASHLFITSCSLGKQRTEPGKERYSRAKMTPVRTMFVNPKRNSIDYLQGDCVTDRTCCHG